ncbi:hypothetical protein BG000_011249 [Podila horticola]|nr:hypothetical protein BG000_011249 [Podila horticola]
MSISTAGRMVARGTRSHLHLPWTTRVRLQGVQGGQGGQGARHETIHMLTKPSTPTLSFGQRRRLATISQQQETDTYVRRDDSVEGLLAGLVEGDRYALARAITLVESSNPQHRVQAQRLLSKILEREATLASQQSTTLANSTPSLSKDEPSTDTKDQPLRLGKSFRIGLSGPPGVGKSTFIESFGMYLVSKGHRVSVLVRVENTSSSSHG